MNKKARSRPIGLRQFHASEGFWKDEMELVRKNVIPYQWYILNDWVEEASPSFCMRNFKVARKLMKEKQRLGKEFKSFGRECSVTCFQDESPFFLPKISVTQIVKYLKGISGNTLLKEIVFYFSMTPQVYQADERVREDIGKAAEGWWEMIFLSDCDNKIL